MSRDRVFERDWLERAARDPEFAPRVAARLERAAAELGEDSFLQLSPRRILDEIAQEGLDVAGWGVLARQLLDGLRARGAPPDVLERVGELIDEAAMHGAHVDLLMRTAASYLPHPDAPA